MPESSGKGRVVGGVQGVMVADVLPIKRRQDFTRQVKQDNRLETRRANR